MPLGPELLGPLVRRLSDATLERGFGVRPLQRATLAVMARRFDPRAAAGFEGLIVYELSRPETGRAPLSWTIEARHARARTRPGAAPGAALTLRLRLADFIRVSAGAIDPATLLLTDRASVEGDLGLAARLPEMFGAPRPR
jgi:hypothetical protein